MLFGKPPGKKAENSAQRSPKKRRKPQDRTKLTRNRQVQIRLTESEVAALKAAAKTNSMSLADFVMSGVSQARRIVVPDAGPLRSELLQLGRNLNQALKIAYITRNEGQRIDTASIESAVNHIEAVIDKFNDWLTKWDVDLAYKTSNKEE